jgi:molecular chaperone GrpE
MGRAVLDGETTSDLAARLDGIEKAIVDHHSRAVHREAVIDRLHAENQELRGGLRRGILDPVVADLIRLHDGLTAQVTRLAGDPDQAGTLAMFASFADDVEMALDRCGIEVVTVAPGDPFDPALHAAVEIIGCTAEQLHNTVAVAIAVGFRERDTGRIRRHVKARFHQFQQVESTAPDSDDDQQPER